MQQHPITANQLRIGDIITVEHKIVASYVAVEAKVTALFPFYYNGVTPMIRVEYELLRMKQPGDINMRPDAQLVVLRKV